jgi:hypothetical protein
MEAVGSPAGGVNVSMSQNQKVGRIYPEAITGTINWMEDNFHEIDSFVVTFKLKDKTSMTIHHTESYFEALAIAMLNLDTIQKMGDDFTPSKGG